MIFSPIKFELVIDRQKKRGAVIWRGPPPPVPFLCPTTGKLFSEPFVNLNGDTFERGALSRDEVASSLPNHALRSAIEECIERNRKRLPLGLINLAEPLHPKAAQSAALESRKASLGRQLKQLREDSDSLLASISLLGDMGAGGEGLDMVSGAQEDCWLLSLTRLLRRKSANVSVKGDCLSDDLEDEFEALVDAVSSGRSSALQR